MNWDAIGAVGEILGASVVLITLIYLAIQIRHVREQNESTALDHVIEALNDFAGRIAESETLAGIVTRGNASYRSLSEAERLRYDMIHYYFLNNLESWYVQHERLFGISKSEAIDNIRANITQFCDSPGFREFWQAARPLYAQLADLVDETLNDNSRKLLDAGAG